MIVGVAHATVITLDQQASDRVKACIRFASHRSTSMEQEGERPREPAVNGGPEIYLKVVGCWVFLCTTASSDWKPLDHTWRGQRGLASSESDWHSEGCK